MTLKRYNSTTSEWVTVSGKLALVDNLITESSTEALTAKQGKILQDTKQATSNLVTAFQATPDDTHYPSEKLVKDTIDGVFDLIYPVGSIYVSINNTLPASISAHGTWEKLAEGKCLWNTASGGGTEIAQALPNIKGNFGRWLNNVVWSGFVSGPFAGPIQLTSVNQRPDADTISDAYTYGFMFDANKANSIYQDGANVQPPAIAVCMWQRTA